MADGPDFAEAATLIGEPARARMLGAMMDGRAWTATELAMEAGIGASTASVHLARLVEGGLVGDIKQGRHRYFRLAGPDVAYAIEGLMKVSARTTPTKRLPGPRDARMRLARTCYDHLAGSVAVALFKHIVEQAWISGDGTIWSLTPEGEAGLSQLIGASFTVKTETGRSCLDWSERSEHLGGALGRALLGTLIDQELVTRHDGRVVELTEEGRLRFAEVM